MNTDEGQIALGLLLCWGLNIGEVIFGFLMLMVPVLGFALIGGIGIVQLIYVLPFYFSFKKQGKTDTAKGLVIAASMTALLNAACWGAVLGNK